MANKLALTHEQTVEIVDFFDNKARGMERRVTRRLGELSIDAQRKIIAWADGEVYVQYGINIRDLFV